MKPSEAMLKGMEHPAFKYQCKNTLNDGKGGFCANGVLQLGYGVPVERIQDFRDNVWGILLTQGYSSEIDNDVIKRNNEWRWGIRRIAAWLQKKGV